VSLHARLRHELGEFRLEVDIQAGPGLNVLFGPSGAGKSTLLALIAGLQRPSSGTIALHGRTLTDTAAAVHVPSQERRIGMVFQEPLLLPHRSALANVALAVRDDDRHRRRAGAHDWLDRVGMASFATRRPGQLSGGQQQRVALARALAGDPELLLFDEPFSSLDDSVRRQLRGLVHDLVACEQLTALFVTHDHTELLDLADRVVLAEHGRIVTVTDPGTALGDRPRMR
jgi:ABC-type sulfate/molybdate transport systems ATPase subunit